MAFAKNDYLSGDRFDWNDANAFGNSIRQWQLPVDANGKGLLNLPSINGYNNQFSIYTNSVQRMFVDSSGNTGFGTNAPLSNVHVAGTFRATSNLTGTWDIVGIFSNSNASAAVTAGILRVMSTNTASNNALLVMSSSLHSSAFYSDGAFLLRAWNGSAIVNTLTGTATGVIGVGTTSPTVSNSGLLHVSAAVVRPFDAISTPSSSGATGNLGELRFDTSYLYICTASNTWKRIALASF